MLEPVVEARFFTGLASSSDEAACLARLLEARALVFVLTSSSLLSSTQSQPSTGSLNVSFAKYIRDFIHVLTDLDDFVVLDGSLGSGGFGRHVQCICRSF